VVDGSGAAFFVTVFAEKSKYTMARKKKAHATAGELL
jgi:hypothetical protein